MDHLALAVRDPERSAAFYGTYFGSTAAGAGTTRERCCSSTTSTASRSALGPWNEPVQLPAFLHFGVGLPAPAAVKALRERFDADGVEVVEWWEEPDDVSVKCRDPDGYVVEASWEPE